MWQEEPLNARLLFRRQLGEPTTVVENPKNYAAEQHSDNTTTRSVRKKNSQITQPQYQNQTTGQMGYLPPPQLTAQSHEQTQPKN